MSVPPVTWAQRKDKVFFKIEVPEIKNEKITLDGNKFHFEGTGGKTNYILDLELCKDVEKDGSKWVRHGKSYDIMIQKKRKRFVAKTHCWHS